MVEIAVYGATGFTGGLVAERLAQMEVEFAVGGRNESKLEELADDVATGGRRPETVVAGVDEPRRLDSLMAEAEVVINCAGPFVDLGPPVVEAALRTGTHYLDTTGEQEFIRRVAGDFDDDARRRGVALMPACAYEYALGDLAAEIAHADAASRIVVAYAVRNFKMSHGTKKSMVRMLSSEGWTYRGGKHQSKRPGYRLFDVPFPDGKRQKGVWIPGGEAVTVPRRGGVSRVETCVVATGGMAHLGATVVGLVPGLLELLKPLADRIVEMTSGNPHEAADEAAEYLVVAFDPRNGEPYVTLSGVDPYSVTARVITEAASRMTGDDPVRTGFVGPADLFEPRELLETVGVEVIDPENRP